MNLKLVVLRQWNRIPSSESGKLFQKRKSSHNKLLMEKRKVSVELKPMNDFISIPKLVEVNLIDSLKSKV